MDTEKKRFIPSPGNAWDEGQPSDWQEEHASQIIAGADAGAVCILCGRAASATLTAPTPAGIEPLGLPLCSTCAGSEINRATAERVAAWRLEKLAARLNSAGWELERAYRALFISSSRRMSKAADDAMQGQGVLFREGE